MATVITGARPAEGSGRRRSSQTPAVPTSKSADRPDARLADEQQQPVAGAEVARAPLHQADHEQGGERVVEPALRLEHGRDPPPHVRPAQRGEDRCGIGRGHRGSQQERRRPAQADDGVGRQRDHARRHQHAERGQQARRAERAHHLRALGQEPALEQDDHQRNRARVAGERGVVELDPARPVLAQEHAEAEEHQQRRRPEPVDEARGDRAHEEHHGRDDEWLGDVQLCAPPVLRSTHHAAPRARGGTGGPAQPRSSSLRRDE